MGLLSKIMKPIVRKSINQKTPMPPRRKGGLAGLLQRVKDKRLERPISVGGVGGGISAIKEPSSLAPPPQLGVIKPPQRPIGRPILRRDDLPLPLQPPTDDPFLRPRVDAIGGQQPIPQVPLAPPPGGPIQIRPDLISSNRISDQIRIDDRPIPRPSIGGAGGGRPDSRLDDFVATTGQEVFDKDYFDRIGIPDPRTNIEGLQTLIGNQGINPPPKPPRPIPPQDFGFGPGIRPTEMIGPDGTMIGSAGVTPPTMENKPISGPGAPGYFGDNPEFLAGRQKLREELIADGFDPDTPVQAFSTPTVDPVTTAPTPSATTIRPDLISSNRISEEQGTDPIQSMPAPVGALDPVLLGQTAQENLNDPLVRALYFGTQDQPGFYQQLQQAGANLIGQDVPLQQTAGLTPLELLARQQAVAGLGGFEPFLQQNRQLVEQAIDQSRRAEELRDPYYGIAEQQLQTGLGEELGGIGQARDITTGATDRFGRSLGGLGRQAIGSTAQFGGRLGESEDLFRGTVGGYDQGLTQQFYNPFEDAVVQRTIEDVMEAGDKQDIASRAREISAGAFGGSRARLGAQERREALGEGLAKALGSIRQQGFSEAQRTGLSEFARQRAAERAAASGLSGLATSRLGAQQQLGSTLRGLTGDEFAAQQQLASNLMGYGAAGSQARQNLASGMLGIGQQRGAGASALGQQLAGYGSQIGGIGSTQEGLRAGQRGELAGYGGIGRGIAETGLSRIYQQQLGQQQRPLGVLGQIGSMLPGYQQTSTQIGSQYGLPTDPTAAGLGAAFSAYGALAPRQGQS